MSSYVMSDIHGHLDRFNEMLENIQFNSSIDHLYLLGDYVDWGDKSIPLLFKLMEMESNGSTECLMGNHDKMMYDTISCIGIDTEEEKIYRKLSSCMAYKDWILNDGDNTLRQYLYLRDYDRETIRKWLAGLRYFIPSVGINGNNFYLCHSKPLLKGMTLDDVLWDRMKTDRISNQFIQKYPDTIIVSGHTIVYNFHSLAEDTFKCKIYKSDRIPYINIDCGAKAIGKKEYARLGCLRLDDLEEFYV